MDRIAADKATKDYWSNYFKDYGQMWVRDIPRRVKTAMVRTKDLNVKIADGHVVPVAHDISDDGTLSVEASFKGKLDDQEANVLVTAEFNNKGKMLKFEATRIA